MNSMTFPAVRAPINVILPLPVVNSDFQVEIVPDLPHAETEIMEGFVPVTRHLLLFRFTDGRYEFLEHRLTAQTQTFHLDVIKVCERVVREPSELCIVCDQSDATEALAECGHRLLCDGCRLHRSPRFHHCPVCGSVPQSG
jgi:RNA polymerase subunit RPABC4/transcription elongation factor Spt4